MSKNGNTKNLEGNHDAQDFKQNARAREAMSTEARSGEVALKEYLGNLRVHGGGHRVPANSSAPRCLLYNLKVHFHRLGARMVSAGYFLPQTVGRSIQKRRRVPMADAYHLLRFNVDHVHGSGGVRSLPAAVTPKQVAQNNALVIREHEGKYVRLVNSEFLGGFKELR